MNFKKYTIGPAAALVFSWLPTCGPASALAFLAIVMYSPPINAQGMNNQVSGPVVSASSGDIAAGTAAATFAAPTGNGAWILTGFEITGQGATGASAIVCTITGLQGGTLTYHFMAPAGATTTIPVQTYSFPDGLNGIPTTAVVVTCPTFGSGNLHAAVNAHAKLAR